jgi:hypothetical protein
VQYGAESYDEKKPTRELRNKDLFIKAQREKGSS